MQLKAKKRESQMRNNANKGEKTQKSNAKKRKSQRRKNAKIKCEITLLKAKKPQNSNAK